MKRTAVRRDIGERAAAERLIGRHGSAADGPLLVCVAGLHGNEPAGVEALRRVLRRLDETRPRIRGELVALAGNVPALERDLRFVDEDLNRIWTLDRVAALRGVARDGRDPACPLTAEAREQSRLMAALQTVFRRSGGRAVYFLDLHTTSSESVPFATFSDSLRNRSFARTFPVPLVLGVEEEIEGTLLDWVDHLGHVAVGIEGGAHRSPESVVHLERAVWLALVSVGVVAMDDVPESDGLRRRLRRAAEAVPSLFEVRYRHGLREGDGFEMKPGFRNFDPVEEGQLVARDRRGEIRAPESGRLFLPLYQSKGDEGFFLVREVAPFWLVISAVARRLRLDLLARLLPGVRPHPERAEAITVHPRAARPLVVKLFHLLGYRRERPEGGRLVLTRRKEVAEAG